MRQHFLHKASILQNMYFYLFFLLNNDNKCIYIIADYIVIIQSSVHEVLCDKNTGKAAK